MNGYSGNFGQGLAVESFSSAGVFESCSIPAVETCWWYTPYIHHIYTIWYRIAPYRFSMDGQWVVHCRSFPQILLNPRWYIHMLPYVTNFALKLHHFSAIALAGGNWEAGTRTPSSEQFMSSGIYWNRILLFFGRHLWHLAKSCDRWPHAAQKSWNGWERCWERCNFMSFWECQDCQDW